MIVEVVGGRATSSKLARNPARGAGKARSGGRFVKASGEKLPFPTGLPVSPSSVFDSNEGSTSSAKIKCLKKPAVTIRSLRLPSW